MNLLVVIVNYQTSDLVCQNLTKLLPELNSIDDKVIVVDNNSCDGSYEAISQYVRKEGVSPLVSVSLSTKN
jgi:GT2 family glycosyltransferase